MSSVSVSSRFENKAENDLLKSQTDIDQVGLRLKPGLISFGLQPLRWVLACGVTHFLSNFTDIDPVLCVPSSGLILEMVRCPFSFESSLIILCT